MVLFWSVIGLLSGCGGKTAPQVELHESEASPEEASPEEESPEHAAATPSAFRQANEGTLGIRARQNKNAGMAVVGAMTVEQSETHDGQFREVITSARPVGLLAPERFEYFEKVKHKPDAWKKFKDTVFADGQAQKCAVDSTACAACDVQADTDGLPTDCGYYTFLSAAPTDSTDSVHAAYAVSVVRTKAGIPCTQEAGDGASAGFMVRTREKSAGTTVWTDHWVLRTADHSDGGWFAYTPPVACTNDQPGSELRADKIATIEVGRLYELVAAQDCDDLTGTEAQVCGMCVDGSCAYAQLDWHWYAHQP